MIKILNRSVFQFLYPHKTVFAMALFIVCIPLIYKTKSSTSTMSSSTTQETLNRQQLYRLTSRILNENSLHFILISLLFLPFTFFASTAVKFYFSSSSPTEFDPFNILLIKTILASSQTLLTVKTTFIVLAFTCFVILPTVAGIALITFSTNHVMQRKPLTFSSTLKSLSHTYIPLLYTFTAGAINIIILFLAFTLSSITVNKGVKALGLNLDMFFISTNLIVSYALAVTILYFITIWGSAAAITVLESKSGFQTLQQSAKQSTEFRRHSFSIVYITGFIGGTALAWSNVVQVSGPATNWTMILKTGAIYLQSSLTILLYVVANTVLYVQRKVASGDEIAMKAKEGEVSGEYVRLVVNDTDGEVVHELVEEDANGGFNYLCYLLTFVWGILLCVQLFELIHMLL